MSDEVEIIEEMVVVEGPGSIPVKPIVVGTFSPLCCWGRVPRTLRFQLLCFHVTPGTAQLHPHTVRLFFRTVLVPSKPKLKLLRPFVLYLRRRQTAQELCQRSGVG